ncbi:MAG: hypothetical protein IAE91_07390 [Ignavibacteriaceae bacterium]|nr:hypothetical protein [Ignavibacteriaceae bacterium]
MRKLLFIFTFLFLSLFALSCEDGERRGEGTVIYMDLEGGFYGIRDISGRNLYPVNLPKEYQVDGLYISYDYKEVEVFTIAQWGQPVEIVNISKSVRKGL